ncbi:MAG: hypothetical protein JJT75_13925 [Opitutales bacterium]|nr:hypothetical protein [Opitutales bacterium]MCH8541169.1 hypothetical protein [Opitutales bacterium]
MIDSKSSEIFTNRLFVLLRSNYISYLRAVALITVLLVSTGCASTRGYKSNALDPEEDIILTAIGTSFIEDEGSMSSSSRGNKQWEKLIEATGKGFASSQVSTDFQREQTALEAAKYRAMAEIAEKIYGTRVTRTSTVRDMRFASEEIAVGMTAIIQGSHVVHESFDPETGIAEVTIRVGLDESGHTVSKNDGLRLVPASLSERRARAEQAARVRAVAALREQIGKIHIAEEVRVRDLVLEQQYARQHIEGIIENVEYSEPEWVDDIQCNVEARIELTGADLKRLKNTNK